MPVPNNVDSDPLTLEQSSNTTRRSLRQTYIPSKYKDFHVSHPYSTLASYSASTCLYPFNFVLSYRKLSLSYHNIVLSITQSLEPRSYNEASKDPVWIEAMNAEIKALELNDTWVLTDMPQHKNVIC